MRILMNGTLAISVLVLANACSMETSQTGKDIILFLTDSPDEIGMCEPCGSCSVEACRTTPEQEAAWQRHLELIGEEPVRFPEEFDEFESAAIN